MINGGAKESTAPAWSAAQQNQAILQSPAHDRRCQRAVGRTVRLHEFDAEHRADTANVADPGRVQVEQRSSKHPPGSSSELSRFLLEVLGN